MSELLFAQTARCRYCRASVGETHREACPARDIEGAEATSMIDAMARGGSGSFTPLRELLCQKCGRDYPVWFTDNELWNLVVPEDLHFLCMDCFAVMAEQHNIIPTAWYITRETRLHTEDMRRLNWLENRGRVKARKYGDMKDNFHWDWKEKRSLRAAIDEAMSDV